MIPYDDIWNPNCDEGEDNSTVSPGDKFFGVLSDHIGGGKAF